MTQSSLGWHTGASLILDLEALVSLTVRLLNVREDTSVRLKEVQRKGTEQLF